MLLVELGVVLSADPEVAREAARKHMRMYLTLPNYVNNCVASAGTTTISATAAATSWSTLWWHGATPDAIAARVTEHHEAGADHVCIQVLDADVTKLPLDEWRELAPALLAL